MSIRVAVVEQARATIGLSAAPSKLAEFERHLGEGERPGVAHDMATRKGTSTCWLAKRRRLRLAGIIMRSTIPPYEYLPGSAGSISGALDTARAAGAWIEAGGDRMPGEGDMLYLGEGGDWHVCTVERVVSPTEIISIDGGQVSRPKGTAPDDPGGVQMIARKIRTWTRRNGRIYDTSRFEIPGIGFDGHEKRVIGWIDVEKLAAYVAARASAPPAPPAIPAPPPTPTSLRLGSRGAPVVELQQLLTAAGAPVVTADGSFGGKTQAAVLAAQARFGLPQTGIADAATLAALRGVKQPVTTPSGPAALPGSLVAELQRMIGVTADGELGPITRTGTAAYQARLGLPVTGLPDSATLAAIRAQHRAPTTRQAGDEALGTLPQLPGLLMREGAEPGFCRALLKVIRETGSDGDRLAALMSEESGFRPWARNPIDATTLIQLLPKWARDIAGSTPDDLAKMSAIDQVRDPIRKVILVRSAEGRKDPAMAGWGNSISAPDDTVIATAVAPFPKLAPNAAFYEQNKVYDKNHDGKITTGEVRAEVYDRLVAAAKLPRVGADGRPVAAT